jgi:uncharacterized protein (TIGR02246 family)
MTSNSPLDSSELILTALRFNDRINHQDIEGLAKLMTNDHTFIDSEGNVTKGKDAMKQGWKEFFKKYPDYRNRFTSVTVQDNVVVMVGYSTCSFKPLEGPSIWTARTHRGRVSEWRVSWLNER